MAEMGWLEQGVAAAMSVKGDVTVAPLVGLVTVTAENAGRALINRANHTGQERAFIRYRAWPFSERTWSSFKISLAGDTCSHTLWKGDAWVYSLWI